jgi:hypothetical protein
VITAVVLLCLGGELSHPAPQDQVARYRALLAAGQYVQAITVADGIQDELVRQQAQVEARYWCGDLSGALAAARSALAAHPDDLQLLNTGADLALQLLQIEEGARWGQSLARLAVEARDLPQETREFYSTKARNYLALAVEARHAQESRASALLRAQLTVALACLLATGVGVAACHRARRFS